LSFGDVWRLKRPRPGGVELVVVLQDEVHDALPSRVIAPLVAPVLVPKPVRGLQPAVAVDGQAYHILVNEMASLPLAELDAPVTTLTADRAALLAAVDLLTTGA
jgi:toxin CcdB